MKPTRRNGGHLFVYILLRVRMEMSGEKGKEGKVWGDLSSEREGRGKDWEEWWEWRNIRGGGQEVGDSVVL